MSPPTVRLKLTLAFDGSSFDGWQIQKTGVGVQEKVEDALARLFPAHPRLHSSSRTDAGVHALGMVAHCDLPRAQMRMPTAKLRLALNAHLPEQIRVVRVSRARPDFHARFNATGKEYRYWVWNHPAMNPLWRHVAWHVPRPLDLDAMRSAARLFVGRHDFRSLTANPGYARLSTVRTLRRCSILRRSSLLTFVIVGDGFLYKMCRGIVGTLVQVGLGQIPPNRIRSILQHLDRRAAGMTAPAHGLVLCRVCYSKPKLPGSPRPSSRPTGGPATPTPP